MLGTSLIVDKESDRNVCSDMTSTDTIGNEKVRERERDRQTDKEGARARRVHTTKERARKRKENKGLEEKEDDTRLAVLSRSIFLSLALSLFLLSFLSVSIRDIWTTYSSDPIDGLREIQLGERSLSLSHL